MTIVYKYGLLNPIDGAEHAVSLLEQSHQLREKLYAIEIERRRAERAAYRIDPECERLGGLAIAASKAEKEALRTLRDHKAHGPDGKSGDAAEKAPLLDALGKAGKVRADCCNAWAVARRNARRSAESVKSAIEAAATSAKSKTREAIAASPLPVTMTDYVRDECQASFEDSPLYDWSYPNDPECRPYDGRGRIGIGWGRIAIKDRAKRDGYTAGSLMAGWPDIRLDRPDAAAPGVRVGQKDLRVLRLRIGGQWIAWPMVLHRTMPPSARVVGVYISSKVRAGRVQWHACFTLDAALPDLEAAPQAWCAAHISWQREDDGAVLVATVLGDDGAVDTLLLSNDDGRYTPRGRKGIGLVRRLEYPETLRSISKGIFNSVIAGLKMWVASIGDAAPEWLLSKTDDAHLWRSHAHLIDLLREWEAKRFDADAQDDAAPLVEWMDRGDIERYGRPVGAFLALQVWQRKDQHLWKWENDQRGAALRSRQQLYREFAMKLVAKYGTIVMAKVNLSEVARKRRSDDEKTAPDPVRSLRHMVAPYELRQAIEQAAVKSGCRMVYVKMEKPTKGSASATCMERCSALFDLAKDPARKDEMTWVFAEKKESFWAKMARKKREKEEAAETARKEGAETSE